MTETSNPILEVLEGCQNGQLIDTLGAACELSEEQCRQSLDRLTPDIARRISERIPDEDSYEDLVDILDEEEQVEYLDDPNAMLSRSAIGDGEDILELLYGSMDQARAAAQKIGPPEGVDGDAFARLMTMAAALTFSALARRNQQYQLAAARSPEGEPPASEGFIAMLIGALITGLMQGLKTSTRRRRRRRNRGVLEKIFGTGTTRRRRSTRKRKRRRRKTPSLNDLLGDILGG